MEVGSWLDCLSPFGHAVAIQACVYIFHILQADSPSVTAIVRSEAIYHCTVARFLHVHIESRVNFQPGFVNLVVAVFFLQVLPNLFDKVWCEGIRIVLDVMSYWFLFGRSRVGYADLAGCQHGIDNHIASP